MAKDDQIEIRARIVIAQPVRGVLHSLQSKDGVPIDPKRSPNGDALRFDFPIRISQGPKFFGDQVRREGPQRRFVYVCIGQSAGDHSSPWSRRMKIDIHDTDEELLERVAAGEGLLELEVNGTGKDGTPACASVRPVIKRIG